MDKDKLKRLAQDSRYIKGIYNYCDRWCERCSQTSRCMNYAIGEEEFTGQETKDINNKAFWNKMSEIMQTTIKMINEMAASEGIDLEKMMESSDYEKEENLLEEISENHELCRMAMEYIKITDEWIDGVKDIFVEDNRKDIYHELPSTMEDGFEGETPGDVLEIIQWYKPQIYMKLERAIRGSIEEKEYDFDEPNQYARDSDGSAKVALIGIDRSIAAWGLINRMFFKFHSHDTGKIIVHLGLMKKKVEKGFPDARAFLRPGFDSVDLND
jgi:hypothetical protein